MIHMTVLVAFANACGTLSMDMTTVLYVRVYVCTYMYMYMTLCILLLEVRTCS